MIRRLLALALLLPTLARADYESVVTADSPCQWWKLQETSGTTFNSTNINPACSGAQNMTTTGSPSLNQSSTAVTGKVSVKFDGNGQYGQYVESFGGCGYTMHSNIPNASWEFWYFIHGNSVGGEQYGIVLGSYEPSKAAWIFYANRGSGATSGVQFCSYGTGGTDCLTAGTAGGGTGPDTVDDTWYHAVGTWSDSATTKKIYINGAQANSNTSVDTTKANGCGENVTIAQAGIGLGGFQELNGNVQYVGFYKTALSSTQVSDHYCAGIGCGLMNQRRIFQSKRPELPQFMDPGYMAQFLARGFNTGLVEHRRWPRRLALAWLPFTVAPDGRGR